MLDSLSTRLQSIFDRLGTRGRLTEDNIQEALREVRVALLEADVNFKVVRAFVDRVREKAIGQDVLKSLTPAQQVVKVVHDELVELLGGSGHRLATAPHPPTIIMLIGLQGSGKTTTAAKLARMYAKQGQHPMLAAADTYRPAAHGPAAHPRRADRRAGRSARPGRRRWRSVRRPRGRGGERAASRRSSSTPPAGCTSTRRCWSELKAIKRTVGPHHVLLVVDAMTGQDAVTVSDRFNQAVGIDAVVLTKMDGDSRGGAALSVRHVTGRPIAFVGMGEKTDALEPFHPDRLASRDARHGRRALAGGEGAGDGRSGQGPGAGPQAARGHASRSTTSASSSASSRRWARSTRSWGCCRSARCSRAARPPRWTARRPTWAASTRSSRSMTLDERQRPGDHQRQPPPAHRARQRHQRAGREPAAQAVRAAPQDDEAVQRHGRQARQAEGPARLSDPEGVTTW